MDARGLSYSSLSASTGGKVSAATIRNWVHGTFTPRRKPLLEVARALGEQAGIDTLTDYGYKDMVASLGTHGTALSDLSRPSSPAETEVMVRILRMAIAEAEGLIKRLESGGSNVEP